MTFVVKKSMNKVFVPVAWQVGTISYSYLLDHGHSVRRPDRVRRAKKLCMIWKWTAHAGIVRALRVPTASFILALTSAQLGAGANSEQQCVADLHVACCGGFGRETRCAGVEPAAFGLSMEKLGREIFTSDEAHPSRRNSMAVKVLGERIADLRLVSAT